MDIITPEEIHNLEKEHNNIIVNILNSPITEDDIDLAFWMIQQESGNEIAYTISDLINIAFDTEELSNVFIIVKNILYEKLEKQEADKYYTFLLEVLADAHNTNTINKNRYSFFFIFS